MTSYGKGIEPICVNNKIIFFDGDAENNYRALYLHFVGKGIF